jgi:integrase
MAREAIGGAVTVTEAIDNYCEHTRAAGARERSVITTGHQLRRFFGPVLNATLDVVTPRKAADLYEALRTVPGPKGKTLAVRTQRTCLAQAKTLFGWCVEKRLVKVNPIAGLKPIGLANRGKPQLRIDEAKKLVALCLPLAEQGEDGALAVLLALLLGMRAGEIISRTGRDLDDGGRVLWIDDTAAGWQTKSRAGKRRIEVPEVLQPLLRRRTDGKLASVPLFPSPSKTGLHRVSWVSNNVRRLCKAADVPGVCAHALRGQHATIAIRAGITPHVVSGALGHESPEITLGAYAMPGSAQSGAAKIAQQQLLN